jgi:hypothetical protein
MSEKPDSAGGAEMHFRELMGPGRGVTDVAHLRAQVVAADRELLAATNEAHALSMRNETLDALTCSLDEKVSELEETLILVRRSLAYRQCELDGARYDLIRAGLPDTALMDLNNEYLSAHQGVWTKGRPFLESQVVWEPGTEDCYLARDDVAPCARRPSRSRCWELLEPGDCPAAPEPIPASPHPVSTGQAFRQTTTWVDKYHAAWSLQDLSREHLLGVIEWLAENAFALWAAERRNAKVLLPCPVNAYPTADAWMRDTPLLGSLLAEKARRRIRRTQAIANEWRAANASPY